MKKSVILLPFLFYSILGFAQLTTVLFDEDFEGATINVTTSSANGATSLWAVNNNLSASGAKSDSAVVVQGDSIFLETTTINASSAANLTLQFNHICKIDFFDRAIIQVSSNNGSSWTTLTASEYNGSAFLNANAFTSISYSNWDAANATSIPQNSWWKSESFDLSSVANQSQVKVRFVLIDADNNGARNNYGWLVDDINVIGAACELVPPTVALSGTIYQGQVYTTGPYNIQADITDASGIALARVIYSINGGMLDTAIMSNTSGNIYSGIIPSAQVNDTICYYIEAIDATTCNNQNRLPTSGGCIEFIIGSNPPPSCVGTPVFVYNHSESFAAFSPGNGTSTVGTLANNWENDPTNDTHDWWVYNSSTGSNNTGPSADHSPADANYMYVEASNRFSRTAYLNTPCFDFTNLIAPKFSFWYHMYGASMGSLHLDIFFGGQWVQDIMPAISGDQGDQWLFREVDLSAYAGNIIKLRFRANTGTAYQSDIAIDDIEITEPLANDILMDGFVGPSPAGCSGSANEFVTITFTNNGSSTQNTIPFAYQVNNGAIVRDTARFTLSPGNSANHTFQQTVNMLMLGNYVFNAWSELPLDGDHSNDSVFNYTVSSTSITVQFPDTTDFEAFNVGVPGTFLEGWLNDATDQHDWYVHTAGTPSNQTGPIGDHTALGLGNYVYVEATTFFNQEARLNSKCYDLSNLNAPELNFYYHMSGIDMGELHIDVLVNGFLIQDIIQPITGNQGVSWNLQTIDLTPFKGTVKIIFRGVVGNGYRSDIAIDGVSIRDAQPVGIANHEIHNTFDIYPNPFDHELNIFSLKKMDFRIVDMIGKQVSFVNHPGNGSHRFNLDELEAGVYFLIPLQENSKPLKMIKN